MMMQIATVVAQRSTCARLPVGAVICDASLTTVVSMGYNGAPRGLPNGCERATPGDCGCVHAEANALIKAPYAPGRHALFTTHTPCPACAKLIINAGVESVFARTPYRTDTTALLDQGGVALFLWNGAEFVR